MKFELDQFVLIISCLDYRSAEILTTNIITLKHTQA